ncbi:DUF938 domain-containing protein [Thalassovita sp.]|uniref:DUF938 domain-containing protein n=1 Tax=Thalassovita sp. TaxID=1979401 RepID=UPI002AB27801|nr:DUF938 domain-containing protein [Thalassovita sp.]
MSRKLTLPDSPNMDAADGDGRLFAPSAQRNMDYIIDLVRAHAPATGKALEIASGTGEHAVALARALPQLQWQPSDPDADRRRSINAHGAGQDNLADAIALNATAVGWSADHGGQNLILLVNLLHLISTDEAKRLIAEAAQALAPGGVFIVYGPFLRDGETTSEGDARFHASLQAQDAAIGYKDDWDVIDWLQTNWLEMVQVVEMPANNLSFIARRPG